MSPILFLDVDGVLNTHDGWAAGHDGHDSLDPGPVARLNALCHRTGCRIVVSSSWRGGPYRGPKGCRAILRRLGVTGPFHRDWRTRDWRPADGWGWECKVRGKQIADWLAAHPATAYAIVDDDSDMLPEQMPRYVKTHFKDGLQDVHIERLIALLAFDAPAVVERHRQELRDGAAAAKAAWDRRGGVPVNARFAARVRAK
ncbi:HAD domain-containing protein [Methylobacterium oryzae]|uniref:HAD domain-containing protein n=1 Tax=Methylobacterium oryzae TaxID=334852 RepID=UPI002F3098A2